MRYMNKREKEIINLVKTSGLACLSIGKGGTGHYRVETPVGSVTFSATPGDHRGDLNKRAMLRRMAAGLPGRCG